MHAFAFALLLIVPMLTTARAWADDATAALDELKSGYRLKEAGDCRAALPHFSASQRLNPSAKASLNQGDCDQRLGDFVAARQHATEGLALAERDRDAELVALAQEQLVSIERRIAHLTINLNGSTPATVSIDGSPAPLLGAPFPTNPGAHAVTVHAPGLADRSYSISLSDGASQTIEVSVGPVLPPSSPLTARSGDTAPVPPATLAPSPSPVEDAAPKAATGMTTRTTVALVLGGAGIVVLGVGSGFGIAAINGNAASNSGGHCDSTGCDPTGVSLRDSALSNATIATVLFGAGLAAVAGGVVLYLTAPKPSATVTSLAFTPIAGRSSGGLGLRGAW